MIIGLDHVVILVRDLDGAASVYQTLLGVAPAWRSRGAEAASVVFTLANTSVELLAAAGEGGSVAAAVEAQGEGLASLCFRVDDLQKMHRRLTRLALQPEAIVDSGTTDTGSGASLAWQRTRAATSAANGVRLFFLQMQNERPRSKPIADAPMTGLDHVVVSTHQPERAAALYGARLDLDMALDRSRPDWGRLMFFRCGDLIVEVVQRPGQSDASAPDKVWGLSWRTADIESARARLVAAGVDASDMRDGRKPGTRVMSLRSGTLAVPTLVLQRSAF